MVAQLGLCCTLRFGQGRVGLPVQAGFEAHIDQSLRKQGQAAEQLGQAAATALGGLQHLQSGDQAVAGAVFVQRQQMARAFSAQQPAALFKLFQHIAVAHLGTHQLYALGAQGQLHGHIGHERADCTGHFFAPRQALGHHQIQHLVAVEQAARGIDQLQAVCVAVERYAVVRAVGFHRCDQGLRMRSAYFVVDVQPIGGAANGNDLGTELAEHFGRDLVGRAVGGVHHDF